MTERLPSSTTPLERATTDCGAKAAGLRWLIDAGYPVPDGIIVTSADDPALVDWVDPSRQYAVRSSASVEDTAEHSFAGQFATELRVEGLEAIREAVRRVIASSHEERLRPYLEHAEVTPDDVRVCAIVQEMVEAEAAGVAFSRNPLTGLADVVIEAVAGTGERLMRGEVTPERWIHRWGDWTRRPASSAVPTAVMNEVARTVDAIAEARGEPVDIEWCWDGEAVQLLQVRPLTVADVPVYSNRISREFLPGMIPPLVWSVNVPIVNGAWLDLFGSLVGHLSLQPDDLARQFAYRAYFNMAAVGDIFERLGMPRDLLEVLMGLDGGDQRPTFRPRAGVIRHLPRMVRLGWRLARYERELDRVLPEATRQLRAIEARDPRSLSDDGLLVQLAELEVILRRLAFADILAPLLFNAYAGFLRRRLEKQGIDAHAIDFGAGEPGLVEYDPTPALRQLASELEEVTEATRGRVRAGELGLLPGGTTFLERFGHLSDSGNDFSRVPWREQPARVAALLTGNDAAEPGGGPGVLDEAGLSRLERRLARRMARYRFERERVSYAYTRGYGNFRPLTLEIARRLVDRGVLDETEDVFCLTRTEMEAAVHGDHSTDTRALVQARRAEMQRLAGAAMPEVIFGDEFEPAPPAVPGQRLSGVPSARGISHGLARVVRGIEEAERVVDGDVLVIPYSDIGWTPLLSRAGGIVAEAGGLLSHSSIVAREFGIPCVVSVSGAMGIPDGALVRVDGFTGEVQWELPAAAT